MIMEIGISAGEIWNILEKQGKIMLSALKDQVDKPEVLILMSVGWLAREGHIKLEPEGEDYKLSLRH